MSGNNTYQRGQTFEDHTAPNVDQMVVIETGQISGYLGVRVAERDVEADKWRAYWCKEQYVKDEVNLNAVEETEVLDEERVQGVEERVRADFRGVAGPETVEEVAPVGD